MLFTVPRDVLVAPVVKKNKKHDSGKHCAGYHVCLIETRGEVRVEIEARIQCYQEVVFFIHAILTGLAMMLPR